MSKSRITKKFLKIVELLILLQFAWRFDGAIRCRLRKGGKPVYLHRLADIDKLKSAADWLSFFNPLLFTKDFSDGPHFNVTDHHGGSELDVWASFTISQDSWWMPCSVVSCIHIYEILTVVPLLDLCFHMSQVFYFIAQLPL